MSNTGSSRIRTRQPLISRGKTVGIHDACTGHKSEILVVLFVADSVQINFIFNSAYTTSRVHALRPWHSVPIYSSREINVRRDAVHGVLYILRLAKSGASPNFEMCSVRLSLIDCNLPYSSVTPKSREIIPGYVICSQFVSVMV